MRWYILAGTAVIVILALAALPFVLVPAVPASTPETPPDDTSTATRTSDLLVQPSGTVTAGMPTVDAGTSTPEPTSLLVLAPLHVRSCAGIDCAIIGYLNAGDIIIAGTCWHGWMQIDSGWVYSEYLSGDPCQQ